MSKRNAKSNRQKEGEQEAPNGPDGPGAPDADGQSSDNPRFAEQSLPPGVVKRIEALFIYCVQNGDEETIFSIPGPVGVVPLIFAPDKKRRMEGADSLCQKLAQDKNTRLWKVRLDRAEVVEIFEPNLIVLPGTKP